MIKLNRLLLIGGTGRNTGKTEFVCSVIAKFSAEHEIYALKVSAIYPDEGIYHGNHIPEEVDSCLFEETRTQTAKDTSRMLRAGAKKVFYLRSDDSGIARHFEQFRMKLPPAALIVSESNSLGKIVKPGLHVMVRSSTGPVKPRAVKALQEADLVIVSDGQHGFPELARIQFHETYGWQLHSGEFYSGM